MSESLQHIIVLSIVGLCVLFLLFQAFGSYFGRKSTLGKCCDKGCDPAQHHQAQAKVHFLPVENLSRGKRGA